MLKNEKYSFLSHALGHRAFEISWLNCVIIGQVNDDDDDIRLVVGHALNDFHNLRFFLSIRAKCGRRVQCQCQCQRERERESQLGR